MISLILWFLILSSGSVLSAAIWKKKYEEVLPITCSFIVLILFLSGILGGMKLGAILICTLVILLYIFIIIWLIMHKEILLFIKNLFTPAFFIFLTIFMGACYFNYGRLASAWDEFSHWADIVKVMTTLDTYGTNPMAHSTFQAYPPGMAVYQYLLQKLYIWVDMGGFSEWRLFSAYQIFAFSFLMPFLKPLNLKKPVTIFLSGVIIFLSLPIFFKEFYTTIYIDPVLSILSGAGLAMVFLWKNKDFMYRLNIYMICAMLVILKDAGILFAFMIAIAFVIDMFLVKQQVKIKKRVFHSVYVILAIIIPKILWNIHLIITNARIVFSKPIDFGILFKVMAGQDDTYRCVVRRNFFEAMATRKVVLGETSFSINYIVLFILMMFILYLLCSVYQKKTKRSVRQTKFFIIVVSIQYVIYVFGLCVTYLFKFGEYEAVRLASFERYIIIEYFAIAIIMLLLLLFIVQEYQEKQYLFVIGLFCIILLFSPTKYIYTYLNRSLVSASQSFREEYSMICSEIETKTEPDSKIYCIVQESKGIEFWVIRFSIRPRSLNDNSSWSIGEVFYEGDVWTRAITSKDFQEELMEEYDYVAIYNLNDYFLDHYSSLFDDPRSIHENGVYIVNKGTRLLELCE